MNRTDTDFAAYEDALPVLLQYTEYVRKLGWPKPSGANGRDRKLSDLNLRLRQASSFDDETRAFVRRATDFARRVNGGIAPHKAVWQAWSRTPF